MDAASATQNDNYQVELEVFSGPLDLLLYLIKKEEVDIYNIPIARITAQYLKYVQMMEKLNLELKISTETLDSQMERNTNLFDENEGSHDEIDEETLKLLSKFNKQPELMEFLTGLVIDMPQNYQWNIRREMVLVVLLHIKTIVDVLVREN